MFVIVLRYWWLCAASTYFLRFGFLKHKFCFLRFTYDCDIRHVFVTQRVTDRKLYFFAIYGSISSNGKFRILNLTRFQFHLKRIYCLTIVICTICYYFSKLKNTYIVQNCSSSICVRARAVWISARVAQGYVVVQFYPTLKIY